MNPGGKARSTVIAKGKSKSKQKKQEKPQPLKRSGHLMLQSTTDPRSSFIVGGYCESGPITDIWRITDGEEWELVAQSRISGASSQHPLDRLEYAGCLLVDRILIFGGIEFDGEGGVGILNDLWAFDIKTGEWSKLCEESPVSERCNHVCVAIDVMTLLVHGGECMGNIFSDTWIYSLDSDSWTEVRPLDSESVIPPPRTSHSGVLLTTTTGSSEAPDRRFVVFGGIGWAVDGNGQPSREHLNDTWALDCTPDDPSTWTWRMISFDGMIGPSPRDRSAIIAFSGGMLLYGGFGLREVDHRDGCLDSSSDREGDLEDIVVEGLTEDPIEDSRDVHPSNDCSESLSSEMREVSLLDAVVGGSDLQTQSNTGDMSPKLDSSERDISVQNVSDPSQEEYPEKTESKDKYEAAKEISIDDDEVNSSLEYDEAEEDGSQEEESEVEIVESYLEDLWYIDIAYQRAILITPSNDYGFTTAAAPTTLKSSMSFLNTSSSSGPRRGSCLMKRAVDGTILSIGGYSDDAGFFGQLELAREGFVFECLQQS